MILLVALGAGFAFFSGAMAQEKPPPVFTLPEKVKLEKITGLIKNFDGVAKAIDGKGKGKGEEGRGGPDLWP